LAESSAEAAPLVVGADGESHPHIISPAGVNAVRQEVRMVVADGRGDPSGE